MDQRAAPLAAPGHMLLPTTTRWSDGASFRCAVERPQPRSIIVVKLDHMGDFVLGLDAMVALRQAFPQARLDLLCAPWNVGLAASLGLFDTIHALAFFASRADGEHPPFDASMMEDICRSDWDLAIDLRVDPDTRAVLALLPARHRCGFEAPDHNASMVMWLPHRLPPDCSANIGLHQNLLMLRLVRSVADLFARHDPVRALLAGRVARPAGIDLSAATGRLLVVCNTASGRAVKNWPLDRFARLIAWMIEDLDATVLLIGTPDQQADADAVRAHCPGPHLICAIGRTTLPEAIGLIVGAALYIGNDSGLTHIAGRLGVPTIALFSGVDPTIMWATLGPAVTVLTAPVTCSPCHILHVADCRGALACTRGISEAAVRQAVRRRLLGTSLGSAAPPGDLADAPAEDAPPVDPLDTLCDELRRHDVEGDMLAGCEHIAARLRAHAARAGCDVLGPPDAAGLAPGQRLCLAALPADAGLVAAVLPALPRRLAPGGALLVSGYFTADPSIADATDAAFAPALWHRLGDPGGTAVLRLPAPAI